jgi:glycosyltransferase involved in cell wall biosynthesis
MKKGMGYLQWLKKEARRKGVDLRYIADRIGTARSADDGGLKVYNLWDAYVHADLVTYPSLWEGFGNALLEAVYFKKPVLVNRYPVYAADIAPLGFDFIEIEGEATEEVVERVRSLLADAERRRAIVEHNFRLGREHFSCEVLEDRLSALLAGFR